MNKNIESFPTKGKNKITLRKLKKNLKYGLEVFFDGKNRVGYEKKKVENKVGNCFIHLAKLATIRYQFNLKNGSCIDIEAVRGDIIRRLWLLIYDCKYNSKFQFNKNKLKTENSTYNFFMTSANILAQYYIRLNLTRGGKMPMKSLDDVMEKSFFNDFDCVRATDAVQYIQKNDFFEDLEKVKKLEKKTIEWMRRNGISLTNNA